MMVCDGPIQQGGNVPAICLKLIGKAELHCPGIARDADDWAVVSVSALYGASVANATIRLRM